MRYLKLKILPLLAFAGLAACGQPGKTSLSTTVQEDLAKLPKNVQSVFYVDVQALKNSELGKEIHQEMDSTMGRHHRDEDYKEFMEATGLDPEKDVHTVLVGLQAQLDGSDSTEHMDGAAFAVVKGNFDENKIVGYLQEKEKKEGRTGLAVTDYNGKKLYTGPHRKVTAYFASPNTVLAGTEEWVKQVIDNKLDGSNLPTNADLMKLIDQLPHKDQLWAVGMPGNLMDRVASELSKHENFKAGHTLRSLKSGMMSAQVNATADLWASATCTTEEDSRLMSEALKGALAMAKLAVSDDRELVDMLNRFEIEAKGTEVHVSGKIDKVFLDKLKERHLTKRMAAF
jgi:hypothetical protein